MANDFNKTRNDFQQYDLVTVFKSSETRIMRHLHVSTMAVVTKIDGDTIQCMPFPIRENTTANNIYAFNIGNVNYEVGDKVLVIFTDRDFRKNYASATTSERSIGTTNDALLHSIDYGVVIPMTKAYEGSLEALKANLDSVNSSIGNINTTIDGINTTLATKQDKLIAGNGILIVGNVISTTDDGMKPGDGLWLDEDVLNVDFSLVQSKIKCGDVPAFENEANQAVGDFFIVESDETPREEPIKKVANSKAKATSIPVLESPPIVSIQQADKETKPSNSLTLGASSAEKAEKKYKRNSLTLTISGNNDEEDNEDTGSHESKAPTLTLGESSADTDTKPNTGCLVLG